MENERSINILGLLSFIEKLKSFYPLLFIWTLINVGASIAGYLYGNHAGLWDGLCGMVNEWSTMSSSIISLLHSSISMYCAVTGRIGNGCSSAMEEVIMERASPNAAGGLMGNNQIHNIGIIHLFILVINYHRILFGLTWMDGWMDG